MTTTTDVAVRDTDSWAGMLEPVNLLAKGIANTDFVPKALRGKEYAVAACVLTGREMGLGPMESLQKIYVVEGRPSLSAELMRSLVMRAGHELRFTELTDKKVTLEGRRAGSDAWTSVTWTIADAQRIGVTGKDVWRKYPRAMLANRATSELCRLVFPDALAGISYTDEEIESEEAATVTVTRAQTTEAKPAKVQRKTNKAPDPVEPPLPGDTDTASDDDEAGITDAEIVEITDAADQMRTDLADANTPGITKAQQSKMHALFGDLNVTERDDRLRYASDAINRDITSSSDLTKSEASIVIESLQADLNVANAAQQLGIDEPPLDGE